MADTPFEPCVSGSIAFADVDGDNDQDVLITGSSDGVISNLYTNDGLGNYSEVSETPFSQVYLSSVAFADVDGDNDQDVLITGRGSRDPLNVQRVAMLYINDGSGTFSEYLDTPFEGVDFSGIAFCDVDGDKDQDIMITGAVSGGSITKLYLSQSTTSSLELAVSEVEFKIRPNPIVDDRLHLSFISNKKRSLTISLLDGTGRILKQLKEQTVVGENVYSIDVSHYPKGIYFFQLDDGEKIGVKKIAI